MQKGKLRHRGELTCQSHTAKKRWIAVLWGCKATPYIHLALPRLYLTLPRLFCSWIFTPSSPFSTSSSSVMYVCQIFLVQGPRLHVWGALATARDQ